MYGSTERPWHELTAFQSKKTASTADFCASLRQCKPPSGAESISDRKITGGLSKLLQVFFYSLLYSAAGGIPARVVRLGTTLIRFPRPISGRRCSDGMGNSITICKKATFFRQRRRFVGLNVACDRRDRRDIMISWQTIGGEAAREAQSLHVQYKNADWYQL